MSASVTSGQIYELRSIANTEIGIGVASASLSDGANLIRWSAYAGNNDQKWVATDTGSGWTLTNVNSGKLMVVYNGNIANGEKVVQWGSGSTNSKWNIAQLNGTDTVTIDGVECPKCVVYAANGTSLALTYNSGGYGVIATYNASDTLQQWALYPTWGEDTTLPAPYGLGFAPMVSSAPDTSYNNGKNGGNVKNSSTSTLNFYVYPYWTTAPARKDVAAFQFRYRTRVMKAGGSYGSWTAWSAWESVTPVTSGSWFYRSTYINGKITTSQKQSQAQYEVRDSRTEDNITYVGASTQYTITFYQRPVLTISSAVWTPDGLTLSVSSNYTKGTTNVKVTSIKASSTEILAEPQFFQTIGSTILVPQSALKTVPANNTSIVIKYQVGTDQMLLFGDTYSKTITLTYDSGSTSVTLSFTAASGLALTCDLHTYTDPKMWTLVDGVLAELEGNGGVFTIYYPFNKAYEIFASGTASGSWFSTHVTRTESVTPVHAFIWDVGFLIVEHNSGSGLSVSDTVEATYNAYDLDSRAYQTVTFSRTKHHAIDVEGALVSGSQSVRDDVSGAVGNHAVYRSPAGELFPVAIIGAKRDTTKNLTEFTINAIRESE